MRLHREHRVTLGDPAVGIMPHPVALNPFVLRTEGLNRMMGIPRSHRPRSMTQILHERMIERARKWCRPKRRHPV